MAYNLYVPVGYEQLLCEKQRSLIIEKLKTAKARTIFIVSPFFDLVCKDKKSIESLLNDLKTIVDRLKKENFNVGFWFSCVGVGGKNPDYVIPRTHNLLRKKSVLGAGGEDWREKDYHGYCFEDENYLELFGEGIEKLAALNPDMIMLDDDVCVSVVPGLGCFCEKHMQIYRELLGEDVTIEQMKERVFTGYNEKYRKVWLKAVGDSLRKLARKMRESINKVNPSVRGGFATGYTSFDLEGADAFELAEIMAGDTLPFLRLSGAPYWCETNMLGGRFTGQKTPTVVEFVRMQKAWGKNRNTELFYEGDTYPRSAYYTSAAMCEAFDLAIRAIGGINGQKYMFTYTGDVTNENYENLYFEKHVKNMPFYDFIEEHFDGKDDFGVKIYNKMHKMETAYLPDKFAGEEKIMEGVSIPNEPKLLSVHGIPLSYGESDIAVAFGDNVKEVKSLPEKLIVDIKAALILQNDRGIDLGIRSCKPTTFPRGEFFGDFEILSWIQTDTPAYYYCELSPETNCEDYFKDINGEKFPASYSVKVGKTEFLVFLFDMEYIEGHNELLLSYPRKAQLVKFMGREIPYISNKCSGTYMVCKKKGNDTAILVQNYWEDAIEGLTIQLDKSYSGFELFGAKGKLMGDKFVLTDTLYPFCSVAIVLKG